MNHAARYQEIIVRAQSRVIPHPRQRGSIERHHAVPKCMGGSNDKSNIVELTTREHFVAHQLLVKMHPLNGKLVSAAWLMANTRSGVRLNSRLHSVLRLRHAMVVGDSKRGQKLSPEHAARIAAGHRGRKQTPEHIAHAAAAQRGRRPTRETRDRMSAAHMTPEARAANSARQRGIVQPIVTCPHCAKSGGGGGMRRWHMDNCTDRVSALVNTFGGTHGR